MEKEPKIFCAMLTTGVCDLAEKLEAAQAEIARLTEELEVARRVFRDASDSYSRLRWPDTTGQ